MNNRVRNVRLLKVAKKKAKLQTLVDIGAISADVAKEEMLSFLKKKCAFLFRKQV